MVVLNVSILSVFLIEEGLVFLLKLQVLLFI
jgi:hypothetical protein